MMLRSMMHGFCSATFPRMSGQVKERNTTPGDANARASRRLGTIDLRNLKRTGMVERSLRWSYAAPTWRGRRSS